MAHYQELSVVGVPDGLDACWHFSLSETFWMTSGQTFIPHGMF